MRLLRAKSSFVLFVATYILAILLLSMTAASADAEPLTGTSNLLRQKDQAPLAQPVASRLNSGSTATTAKRPTKPPADWKKLLPGLSRGCTARMIKAGKCGVRPPRRTSPGRGDSVRPGATSDGGQQTTVTCLNGKLVGSSCVCRKGSTLRRIRRNTYTCIAVTRPCVKGFVHVRGKCIRLPTPGGSSIDPVPPTIPPMTCPSGTHRVGKRCRTDTPQAGTPEPPRPQCRPGWRPRNGKCVRKIGTACPNGTVRRGKVCFKAADNDGRPPVRVPPVAAPTQGPAPPSANAATSEDGDYEAGVVLVEIAGSAPQPIADRLIRTFGLTTLSRTQLTMIDTSLYRFAIPAGRSVEAVVTELAREPGVTGSQPNWNYDLNTEAKTDAAKPASEAAASTMPQYALDIIGARKVHERTRGAGVLVAVIDTGIDEQHRDLQGTIAARYNAFPAQPFVGDTHGTAIAGIIAAHGELLGIAPQARILTVQAFTARTSEGGGNGTSQRIAAGLNWAMMKGARIVNMSFAGRNKDADGVIERLIDKAHQSSIVLVAAAGNGGRSARPAYPASHPAVVAVTAIDEQRALYQHANVGGYVDIAAPGVGIMAAAAGNTYDLASGTSFAAAHVSGVAALILSGAQSVTGAALSHRLKATAADLGSPGEDDEFGAGLVDAVKAAGDAVPIAGGTSP